MYNFDNIEGIEKYLDDYGFYFDSNGSRAVVEAVKQNIIKPASDYFDNPEDRKKLKCWYVRASVKSKNEFPMSLNLDYILGQKKKIKSNKIYTVGMIVPGTLQEIDVYVKTGQLSKKRECQVIGVPTGQILNLSDEKLFEID